MELQTQMNPVTGTDRNKIISFIRALLTLVVAYMLTSICFRMLGDKRYSLPLLIAVAVLFLLTLVFALIRGAKPRFSSIAALLIGMAAGAYAYLNGEQFLPQYCCMHVIVLSYAFFVLSLFGNANKTLSGGTFLLDAVKATFVYPFLSFVSIFLSLFQWKRGSKRLGRVVLFALIGVAAALVLGVIAVSLLSFDAAFAKLFEIDWDWDELPEVIIKMLLCIPLAALIFSTFTSSEQKRLPTMSTPGKAERIGTHMKKVHPVVFLIPVAALLVIYGLFFFTQWDVYMSAFSGVLPSSYTAAEYARSGFFELCAVAAINAILGILMSLFMNETSRAAVILKKIANTLLALATLILIATALSKMILYIRRFDLTVLRLLVSVILVLIAIGFFISVLSQWIRRVKTAPILIVIVSALLLVTPILNVNGRIAKYNVDAYLTREAEKTPNNSIDTSYLIYDLGEAAIPQAVKLLESGTLSERDAAWLADKIMDRYVSYNSFGFFEHSLSSRRALESINEVRSAPICLINGTYPIVSEENNLTKSTLFENVVDEYHWIVMDCSECPDAAREMVAEWRPLPMSDVFMEAVKDALEQSEIEFPDKGSEQPDIQNGVYWFYNQNASADDDKTDDSLIHKTRSILFRLAIYDYDTERMYYLELHLY